MRKALLSRLGLNSRFRHIVAGVGTVTCISPATFRVARLPQFRWSDAEALQSDWVRVGSDLRNALAANRAARRVEQKAP